MSRPDATAIAALSGPHVKPVFFAFLDFVGDPVRCNTSGADITPSGLTDPDINGLLFTGIDGKFADVSSVRYAAGGSQSVTVTVSGLPGLDDATLAMLATPSNWRGRNARLWRVIRNGSNVQQGGYHAYYTGRMMSVKHGGSPEAGQKLTITVESYLASMTQASNRTYQEQEKYDAGDLSAKASIAIANGNFSNPVIPQTGPTIDAWGYQFGGFL